MYLFHVSRYRDAARNVANIEARISLHNMPLGGSDVKNKLIKLGAACID